MVFSIILFDRIKIDDPVGAISVHGICGLWGTIAVGLFSTNSAHTVGTQLIGALSISLFAFLSSSILVLVLKYSIGIRVDEEAEEAGLDLVEHGQPSYADFQPVVN